MVIAVQQKVRLCPTVKSKAKFIPKKGFRSSTKHQIMSNCQIYSQIYTKNGNLS